MLRLSGDVIVWGARDVVEFAVAVLVRDTPPSPL